jgi:glycosyltransferase involved in cell wall biosynthesis
MGRSHDIETVLAVAARLRERKNLAFLFIGDGAKTALVADAARGNPAIQLLPYQLPEMLPRSLSAGDVHVVTQEARTMGMMEPSKLYGVMAAGRPVMFIGPRESETAQTVLRERIGTVTPNGDGRSAVDALNTLLIEGPAIGRRARNALELKYGRSLRTTAIAHTLQGLAR